MVYYFLVNVTLKSGSQVEPSFDNSPCQVMVLPSSLNVPVIRCEKPRRFSPLLPNAACQTHLIYSGNTPLIGVEHGTRFARVIMADDTEGAREFPAGVPIKMPDQQRAFPQPFESRMPIYSGWQ